MTADNRDLRLQRLLDSRRLTRRDLIKNTAVLCAAGSLLPVLGGCGGDEEPSGGMTTGAGAQKKGGNLRVGLGDASAKDTLDAHRPVSLADTCRLPNIYEGFLWRDHEYGLKPILAEEYEGSADARVWTFRVKPDIEFHNGKTVTADDCLFTYQRIFNPDNPTRGSGYFPGLKPSDITKVDDRTIQIELPEPDATLPDKLGDYFFGIVPEGYDPANPIGTGPFKVSSFDPGQQSVFEAFENYRGPGPYLDELTMVNFADQTARINALVGGELEAISQIPADQVKVIEATPGLKTQLSKTAKWYMFFMRHDVEPYSDERVRQAIRLLIDREAMIDQALSGYGRMANDIYGLYDPMYNDSLPQREQDVEKAVSLLKQAGYEDYTFELSTSPIGAGVVEAAQVFQEQARQAGVKVKINQMDTSIYWGDKYLQHHFGQDYWGTRNYLPQVALIDLPESADNESHWDDPEYTAIIREALQTIDDAKRKELVWEAQAIQWERGTLAIWTFLDIVDAYSDQLNGIVPDACIGLNNFYFGDVSFV